jgi:pimeloyl-ACP methyl ester carboxylesterase
MRSSGRPPRIGLVVSTVESPRPVPDDTAIDARRTGTDYGTRRSDLADAARRTKGDDVKSDEYQGPPYRADLDARRGGRARTGRVVRALAAMAVCAIAGTASAAPSRGAEVTVDWASCGTAGAQCASVTVPKDYDSPNAGTIQLAVAKSPATNPGARIGSLFFNFGGPGAPAAIYVQVFGSTLFPVLNERFDIVGVDPRGTGGSVPVDCKADQEKIGVYAQPFTTPDNLDVGALINTDRQYIGRCIRENGDILRFLSTANVARDMIAISGALGDEKVTYLGFSYGTFLGSTIQSLFPGKVVLDGPLDADQYINNPLSSLDEQSAGFERAIKRFSVACGVNTPACGFGGGDPVGRIDALIEKADETPIPASNAPDRPVDGDDIRAALVQESYSVVLWPELAAALAQLEQGDGAGIRTIMDDRFYGRNDDGTYDPALDRYFLLSAGEQRYPRSLRPFLEAGRQSYFRYDYAYWNHGYSEAAWGTYPIRARDVFRGPFRTGAKDPTTLVVGTRYDPATTYKQAKRLTAQLGNARLLTMNGDGHTAYDGFPDDGFNSKCVDTAVEGYLFDLTVPAKGTQCAQDQVAFPAAAPAGQATGSARKIAVARGMRPIRLK